MKSEFIFPHELRDGDMLVVKPKIGPSYAVPILEFKRTDNAVSFRVDGQHKHFATVGRAREGLKIERVVMDHTENPYPFKTKTGKLIYDELCACGKLRSQHGPGFGGAFGHGSCELSHCPRFTWVMMIDQEAAERAFDAAKAAGEL
jgi:hypothetical protein